MKKALSGVLAASLVMSSFASVAFAAETTEAPKTPKTPEEMFEVLKTAGVFEGFEDGTAGLNKSMTRAQVAKVLVKLLKLEENKAGASVYNDLDGAGWAEGFIGAATKAGVMDGVADGKFDPSGTFTTEQLAAVLVRALKLPLSTEAAEGVVADWAKAYVATAVKAGLITKTADYTQPALRSVLVSSSFAAKTQLDKPVVVPQAITAEIKGYETVLVKFAAAADTSKVKFELKKGTTTKAHKVTWNEAKTEATLALDSKLTEGEYGLSVTGASEAAYTQTFKVEAEKVVSIKFDSDKAPLERYSADVKDPNDQTKVIHKAGDTDDTKVSLSFKVLNQYGEDIADKVDVDVDASDNDFTVETDDNTITITNTEDEFSIGDKFRVNIEYDDENIFVDQEFTVASEGHIASVKNLKLYNEDKETLDTETDLTDDEFYVTFEAIDQYGNQMDADDYRIVADDLSVNSSNDDVVEVDEDYITSLEVDGEDVLALQLKQTNTTDGIEEGKTTISIMAQRSGSKETLEVEAKEVDKVGTFTLSTPEIVVAGEENVIPFTALDTNGKEITDIDVLNDKDAWDEVLELDVDGAKIIDDNNHDLYSFNFEKTADGKIQLILDLENFKLDSSDDKEDSLTNFTTATIEGSTFTEKDVSFEIKVKEKAVALDIVDVNPDEGALAVNGTGEAIASTSFERGDIVVVDQYDREDELDEKKFDNYDVVIIDNGDKYAQVKDPVNNEWSIGVAGTDTGKAEMEFALVEKVKALDGKYLENTKDYLGNAKTIIEDSNYDFSLSVVDVDDIVGYDVEEFTELYASSLNDGTTNPYAKEFEVVGLMKDGTEVALPQTGYEEYYTVSIPDELYQATTTVGTSTYELGTIYATVDMTPDAVKDSTTEKYDIDPTDDKTDANIEVNVIGKTTSGTKEYTRKIAVSTHEPKVVTQALDDDNDVSKEGDGVVSVDFDKFVSTYSSKVAKVAVDAVKSTDQYGFEVLDGTPKGGRLTGDEIATSGGVTFSNLTDSDRDQDAEIKAGDDLSVTVTAPSGKKITFKLHIK